MRQFAAIAIGGVWLLTMGLGVAQAGPFGGDDPGCVPSTKANLKCSDGAYKAFIKAYKAVIKCHIKQADATFKGAPVDDEPCENTAKSKLDIALGKLDCSGSPGVLTNVGTLETTLFATSGTTGSADQQNGSIYCDGGTAIDGSGEDAGTVNTNPTDGKVRQKCADGVWKGISKLLGAVCKCHVKEADSFFALKAFDENACEETNAGKGAHEKFTASMAKLTCPQGCLDAPTRAALGNSFIALLEAINDKFYPCASTTTTTTTVTTSTTSTTTTAIPASCGNRLVDPGEQCDPPGSPCIPIGSPMGAFLCNESCQCTAACCGFANGGPKFLRFATITQAGNCGTLTTGGGPVNLACSGLYFGGAGETVALPAKVPDMGVYISKVASCSGTTLTLVAATKADTGSIRTCSSAQGHCVTSAVGSGNCNLTTFTCNGTGTCTGGACTTGKKGIPCAANTDCNLDCNTDIDCGVCDVGYVGAHCRTDHQCSCLFGAPLPVPNTTVANASTCVINSDGTVNNPDDSTGGYGSVDCSTGVASTFTPLNSEIYLTGDLMTKRCSASSTGGKAGFNCTTNSNCQPGPGTCVNDPAIEPCPVCNETTLKCNGGPNEGAPCTPGSSGSGVLGAAYPTSHDCPPPGTTAADIGALAVPITYTTQTSTATSYSTGAGGGKSNVFCTFCKDTVNGFANPPVQCSCDNGLSCGGFGPCPSASFASCEQNQNGAFAHADATMIEEDGVAAGDLRPPGGSLMGPSKPATEVGVFCIPPSYNSLVDQNAGLPGPGAVALPGNAQLLP